VIGLCDSATHEMTQKGHVLERTALSGGGVKVDVRFPAFVNGLSTLPDILGRASASGDLDPNSRTFQAAARACQGVAPDHAGTHGRNASLLGGRGKG
jgi:hypothetical protein